MKRGSKSPRILYVTQFWPHGPAIGAQLRSLNVLRALQQVGNVEVVVLDDGALAPATGGSEFKVAYSLAIKKWPDRGFVGKLRWTLDPRYHYPNGWGVEGEAMRRILESLASVDMVWFHKLRSPDLFPSASWPASVVDIDDVPSTYEHAILRLRYGPVARLLTQRKIFALQRREKLLGERFTLLAVCSEEDSEYLKRMGVKAPIHVIPNAFERPRVDPVHKPVAPTRIGFIGTFDYFPNTEGIHWFVNECWRRIKAKLPNARLRLVGRGSDSPLAPTGPDVDSLGWLGDPSGEISTWTVMVVPIRVGAGTRIKIAQAFSQKCPVVSTSSGAHGYQLPDRSNMYVADTAAAFADACVRATREPVETAQMADRAWRRFLETWTWDAIRPRVWAAVEDCLRRRAIA